eukprot:5629854-Alexandrium_andersonii.AAC.1
MATRLSAKIALPSLQKYLKVLPYVALRECHRTNVRCQTTCRETLWHQPVSSKEPWVPMD